ncbi:MAG TPA: sugar transferase [Pyrinomonadaceae bacterium]|jgi:lipopolysaccharide/colanic/teichoic acid biosynthesis glycosyltransferase|nr:sugar transferase [Pyrinomonadaceae bacterium]
MGEQRFTDVTTTHQVKAGIPRPVEAVIALLALVAAAPLVALSALAVVVASGRPVLFRQQRVGRRGRAFTLYKLRTMRAASGGAQVTAAGDARVTRVGRVLRKTKLDELPNLWNVVRGEMSLVGPRPEVPRYVDRESAAWRLVLEARPGLTDPVTLRLRNEEALLAEVRGDRERFYTEALQPFKLAGYAQYLCGRSWRVDVKILWATVCAVASPRGAQPPTLEEVLAHGARGDSAFLSR